MTIEEATEEMNQAAAALALAQQHLLEAAAEATQNLSDIKRILGFEQPAMKLAAPVKKLRLPESNGEVKPSNKIAGRRPPKSPEELMAELEELERQENPDKKASARKAQIRWLLRKKGALDPAPDRTVKTTVPKAAPEPVKPEGSMVEIKNKPALADIDPALAKQAALTEQYKVLVHEHGLWKIKMICSKEAAQAELTRLTFEGYEARIKRIQ